MFEVKQGRMVNDEPVDQPDGEIVELVPVEDVLASGGDLLEPEDREHLHAAIDRGLEDGRAGRVVSSRDLIARLRAKAGK